MFDYFRRPDALISRPGKLTANAIICPLAFGRNTWDDEEVLQQFASFRMRSARPLTDFDLFRVLERRDFDPGLVNRELAETCFQLASQDQEGNMAPYRVFGQWEVMYALYRGHTEWYEKFCFNGTFLRAIWPEGTYLSTRDVLERVVSPGGKIVLVAQGFHLGRCLRLADRIYGRSQVIAGIPSTYHYDPKSMQPWTRDHESFTAQEKKARIFDALPAPLRWLIRKFIGK